MKITTAWRNDNPNTIWNKLVQRLGREPTNDEVKRELDRIMTEATIDLADAGKLRHQRRSLA